MFWILILIVIVPLGVWLRWRHNNKKILEVSKKFPGPTPLPILGNALEFSCGPVEMINVVRNLLNEYGDVVRLWFGPELNVIINDPDDLKILLTSSKTSYKGPQYKYMAEFLGGGILSGSGPKWRQHRKLATPNYGKRAIDSYSDKVNEEVDIMVELLRQQKMDTMINIYHRVVKCTTLIVCQTLLGLTRDQTLNLPQLKEVVAEAPSIYVLIFNRMTKWYLQLPLIHWLSGSYMKQRNFVNKMNELCNKIVENATKKQASLKNKFDLLETEEDSSKNTELSVVDRFVMSQIMDQQELFAETFTIFTSSQEATAKISSLALLMLAYHPKCQEKLYNEIKQVTGNTDRWITDEDFKNMPYLDMVFKEVIRMFPIGAMLQRTISEDIDISCGTLPAGLSLVIPIYHMHRDPRHWKDPEAFDPERFTLENSKNRHPYCYMPFSLGPMDCLGRYFAIKLVKSICARVVKNFELYSHESYSDLTLSIAISTFPVKGFPLMLRPRK